MTGAIHRMPVHFGPTPGPRQTVGGGRHQPDQVRETWRLAISFRSEAAALESLLPPGCVLDGEPIARIEASFMTGIPWLAGRGYNTLGLTIPACWQGEERISGDFVCVLFENLADPIISGREELGWNKVWCELPPLERGPSWVRCRAAWLGFQFAELELTGLNETPSQTPAPARPKLAHKYIPSTGDWGEADVDYVVVSPPATDSARPTAQWAGNGTFSIAQARWQDLPTLVRVVNGLAELPVREMTAATFSKTIGSDDLYGSRRVR